MGPGPYYNPVKEKGLSTCQHLSFLWSKGRIDVSHFDPLPINLGPMDYYSFFFDGQTETKAIIDTKNVNKSTTLLLTTGMPWVPP